MTIRELERSEINEIWSIDRSEVIDGLYHYEDGQLVLRPEHYDVTRWPPGHPQLYGPTLLDCFDRGGTLYGAFDEERLIGVVVLESRFMGREGDQLQLVFLHVSRAYRGRGPGGALFAKAAARARELGARRLYVSSIPTKHTVDFYFHLGCHATEEVDARLLQLEPDDIHLEYVLPESSSRSVEESEDHGGWNLEGQ